MHLPTGTWQAILWVLILATVTRVLQGEEATTTAEPFATTLEEIREKFGAPGLAAAAFVKGEVVEAAAVGYRKSGDPTPVTVEDRWHLGSCTKAMTATLAATLVEDRKIGWTTTVASAFPELARDMHPGWRQATLAQLLTHRGGAPAKPPDPLWLLAWQRAGTPRDQRLAFTFGLLQMPPEAPPGTAYIYSNQGYAIAGVMLERTLNRPWEDLLRERLFQPLGMQSAGYGAPGDAGTGKQPWGHRASADVLTPISPGPDADNPPAIGPAGTVHCSIRDFARFAGLHAQGVRNAAGIRLGESTWRKLHTPPAGERYAMGWLALEREWAHGPALTHAGSNTTWYAVMWVAPGREAAFVAATNFAGEAAPAACDAAVSALVRRYSVDPPQ